MRITCPHRRLINAHPAMDQERGLQNPHLPRERSHNGCGLSDCLAARWACDLVVCAEFPCLDVKAGIVSLDRPSHLMQRPISKPAHSFRLLQQWTGLFAWRSQRTESSGWSSSPGGGAREGLNPPARPISLDRLWARLTGPARCYRVDDHLADQAVFVVVVRLSGSAPSFLCARSPSADGRVQVRT